ncbi:Heme-binding protein A precursor [Nocardioides dokdonensis FR1436]|uniref:Heme-binding protein A n=1 Tax=Nocardioides dokdonensis FR1436 TaxID=1300347 RepID=A0A1A9GHC7_9ACTN|nr:ABC transporter substrate-binding protein [Nocardioides dokdonensis]ANH37013.1 Heme-binding protein A precursor [Nocardioides dokdonensis FR1436]
MNTRISMRARVAAVLCSSALVVTGCASSDSTDEGSSSTAESAKEIYVDGLVNVEEAGDPVEGGTLKVVEYSEAATLNPIQTYATGQTGLNVMASVYDTLMRWDMESETWEPQLAESLETDDDGTTWTLTLREGVDFTDGTPLDAKAVLGSLNYYFAGYGFGGSTIQSNLDSMEATDERTVTFTFTSPWATFPQMLAGGPGLIMAPAAYKNPEKFQPIGAGPFVLDDQAPGEKTTVVANEDYFDGRPPLDAIEFLLIPTDTAKYQSLEAGEVDVAYLRQDDIVVDAVEEGWAGAMNAVSGARTLNLNAREGTPTSDVRVRQAINLAIDAGTYLQRTTDASDLADRSLMADFSTWSTDVEPVEADVEAAAALLEEAKADGFDGKVRYLGQSDASAKAGAVAIKAMLEAAGFEVTLDLVNTVADQVKKIYVDGDFDIALGGTSISDSDPYSRLYVALNSTSGSNPGRYANPDMDALLAELKTAVGPEEGLDTMAEIEELWKDEVPYINLSGGAFFEAWGDNVHGIQPTSEAAVLFDEAWISQD